MSTESSKSVSDDQGMIELHAQTVNILRAWRLNPQTSNEDLASTIMAALDVKRLQHRLGQYRDQLDKTDAVLRDGLPVLPRIMDRIEFAKWCVTEHQRRGNPQLRTQIAFCIDVLRSPARAKLYFDDATVRLGLAADLEDSLVLARNGSTDE